MFRYSINPESEIPVYRQLVDQINAQIRSGALKTGTQLPTVREMAQQMNLSCGTVKRVYDCLREMGDIEMIRRRGSFVKYVREDGDSRKLKAMTAIDRMIRQLSDLQFSPAEIQIFLNLKLREWGLKWSGVHIAMVTEYTEFARTLERQLGRIGNARIIICGLRQIREYPYSIDEEADVILASPGDAQALMPLLPDASKLVKLAFSPRAESVQGLALLRGRVGVIYEEEDFVRLVRDYLPDSRAEQLAQFSVHSGKNLRRFLTNVDSLILFADWQQSCPSEVCAGIEGFMGEKVQFNYEIDEGSMIYLEERINRIREERQIRPGALRF